MSFTFTLSSSVLTLLFDGSVPCIQKLRFEQQLIDWGQTTFILSFFNHISADLDFNSHLSKFSAKVMGAKSCNINNHFFCIWKEGNGFFVEDLSKSQKVFFSVSMANWLEVGFIQ